MFKLLESLKRDDASRRVRNQQRYRELLGKGDGATPAEGSEIADLARELGKDVAAVESDLRAITDRARLNKLLALEPERKNTYDAAKKKQQEFADKMEAAINEMQGQLHALTTDLNRAETEWHTSRRAENFLFELEVKHFELFGIQRPERKPFSV